MLVLPLSSMKILSIMRSESKLFVINILNHSFVQFVCECNISQREYSFELYLYLSWENEISISVYVYSIGMLICTRMYRHILPIIWCYQFQEWENIQINKRRISTCWMGAEVNINSGARVFFFNRPSFDEGKKDFSKFIYYVAVME